jgi:hypothetical protein
MSAGDMSNRALVDALGAASKTSAREIACPLGTAAPRAPVGLLTVVDFFFEALISDKNKEEEMGALGLPWSRSAS